MTENEAISYLRMATDEAGNEEFSGVYKEMCKLAIQALEGIQQYREIGTVRGYERAIETSEENYNLYREYKALLREYERIGTIDEFKAFKLGRLGNKGFITIGQTIEEFKKEIRNKAIDEFVEVLKEKNKTFIIGNRMIEDIAEQLKGVQE